MIAFLAAAALAVAPAPCAEDDVCWTWSTMGTRSRGVTLVSGRHVVVRPCRFARLDRSGRIDWKATPKLRGDATARAKGCRS